MQSKYTKWAKQWISDNRDDLKEAKAKAIVSNRPLYEIAFEIWNKKFGADFAWFPEPEEGGCYEEYGKALAEEIGIMKEPETIDPESGTPPKILTFNHRSYALLPLKKTAADEHVFQDQEGYKPPKDGDQFPFFATDTGDKTPEGGVIGETERKAFEEQARQGRQNMKEDAKGTPGAPPSADDRIESPEYVIAQVTTLRAKHAVVKARVKEAIGGLDEFIGAPVGEFAEVSPPMRGERPPVEKPPKPPRSEKAERPKEKGKEKEKVKDKKEKAPPEIQEAFTDLEDVLDNLDEAVEILDTMSSLATAACDERKSTRWSLARKKHALDDIEEVKEILEDAEEAAESAEKSILKAHPGAKPKKKEERGEGEEKEKSEKKEVKEEMKEEKGAMRPEEILGSLSFLSKVGTGINRLATSEPMPGDEAEFTGDKQVPGVGDVATSEMSRWKEMATGDEAFRRQEGTREPGSPMSAENRWEKMKDEQVGKYSVRFVDNQIPAKVAYVISAFNRRGDKMGHVVTTFESAAKGNLTKENFDLFTSDEYKRSIGEHLKTRGIKSVGAELHGQWVSETGYKGSIGNVLEGTRKFDPYRARKKAGKPKGHDPGCDCNFCAKSKGKKTKPSEEEKKKKKSRHAAEKVKDRKLQQDYYADMYGDPDFARLMVSKIRSLQKQNTDLSEKLAACTGDMELEARAKRGYDLAVEELELGIIDNDEETLIDRTEEIAIMDDDAFEEVRSNIAEWKRQGQIGDTLVDVEEGEGPDLEAGIESDVLPAVAERGETEQIIIDPSEQRVREPGEVNMHQDLLGRESAYNSGGFEKVRGDVEGLEKSRNQVSDRMKTDLRRTARNGSVVPQMTKLSSDLSDTEDPLSNLHKRFTTVQSKIERAGVPFSSPATRRRG